MLIRIPGRQLTVKREKDLEGKKAPKLKTLLRDPGRQSVKKSKDPEEKKAQKPKAEKRLLVERRKTKETERLKIKAVKTAEES